MGKTAELERLTPRDASDAPAANERASKIVPLRQPTASDRAAGMQAVAGNGEPWQRALASDASAVDTIPSGWSSSHELYMAARSHRAFVLGELAAVAVEIVADFGRSVAERYRRSRRAAAAREALRQLDDRTLRDLGIDRSEIASVAAEAAGATESSLSHEVRVRGR